jgi:L,D-transpeptidase catalytic domain
VLRLALAALAVLPAAPPARPEPAGLHTIAVVRATIPLRAAPHGRVVAWAAPRTEFGSRRRLWVAARRRRWLGVVATELGNGRLGWIHEDDPALALRRTAYSLHADLSGRWLELRRGAGAVRRLTVGIGAPGSETPTGRFAVTDKLSGPSYSASYGCCILAMSGHQPNLPAGWRGGDRLAIHGTSSGAAIGDAGSAGCLRAAEADLRVLMRRVPLGTPVFVRH